VNIYCTTEELKIIRVHFVALSIANFEEIYKTLLESQRGEPEDGYKMTL
jgi:hypothetical protein